MQALSRVCVRAILGFYTTGGIDFASSVIGSDITFSPSSLSLTPPNPHAIPPSYTLPDKVGLAVLSFGPETDVPPAF